LNQMMAYCGLMCDECPAYKATVNNNDELRKKTAGQWSKMFNTDILADQINCLGCRSEVHFAHCGICKVRACNLENSSVTAANVMPSAAIKKISFWIMRQAPGKSWKTPAENKQRQGSQVLNLLICLY